MSEKYVDVREKAMLEMLDTCKTCKKEYVVRLHVRHECGECVDRRLHAIFHSEEWQGMWMHFNKMFDHMGNLFKKVFG